MRWISHEQQWQQLFDGFQIWPFIQLTKTEINNTMAFFLFWYLLAPHLAICSNDLQIKITHLKVFVDRFSSSKRLSCSTRISVAQNGVNSNIYLLLLRTSLKHLHIGALLCCEIATHNFLETVPVVLFELY